MLINITQRQEKYANKLVIFTGKVNILMPPANIIIQLKENSRIFKPGL